ncbi:MAG: DUF3467 domain-containing protein [Candidatus Woesearchaeota archaeon]
MPDKEPINIQIIDGEPFFAHEMTANFTPTQFSFDFKCITPRVDPRSKKPSFLLKHNVIMVEPYHAKMILGVLSNVIKKYEEEYGVIKKPKPVEIAEKKHKKAIAAAKDTVSETPTYLG